MGYPYLDTLRPALESSLPMPGGPMGTEPGSWRVSGGMTAIWLLERVSNVGDRPGMQKSNSRY